MYEPAPGSTTTQDVSLFGFDDAPSAKWLEPGLSTVYLPIDNMITTAIDQAIKLANESNVPIIVAINKMEDENGNLKNLVPLNERETDFLKYACTELTYKEIAEKMFLSPRTIDGYRDALFEKLNVKTRVGLVMYAIKNGIVRI